MKLEITMNDNTIKVVDTDIYDVESYTKELNDRETFMIAIGDTIFNKQMIRVISPVE